MNKKQSTLVLVVAVLIIIGTVIGVRIHDSDVANKKSPAKTTSSYQIIYACNLLTSAKAKELIGPNAVAASSNGAGGASADVYVSICSYSNNDSGSPTGIDSIMVTVRSAKNLAGSNSNNMTFTSLKPVGSINVSGYGSEAIWDQAAGQLDVLYDHDTIYITATGSNTQASSNTLSNAEVAAKVLVP